MSQPEKPAGWELLFKTGKFPPRYQAVAAPNESVVNWAQTLPAGAFVLDVGCGVGRHVLYLGGQGFKLAGVDVSPFGVAETERLCAEQGIPFEGQAAPMSALPWPDNTFDAVLSTSTLSHGLRADIQTALDEIRRVLKPGGLLLADFPHQETLSYQRMREQVAQGGLTEIEPDTFVDDSPQPNLEDDAFLPHHYTSESALRVLMGEFEILNLWADLKTPPDGGLPQRGYWVVSARKPL